MAGFAAAVILNTVVLLSMAVTATVIFATGLLSKRVTTTEVSREVCDFTASSAAVDQVVLVLIDALRPDFAIPSLQGKRPSVGASLTYIEEALREKDTLAMAMLLVADAPTTTSQRLRALTAGVVPAFVEAGSNFNSDEVEEDNLIFQLKKHATVLGDDTWLQLYGASMWQEHFVYPSFDVRDLHTVDRGVLKHLFGVLNRPASPPKLVIAHFLGVDHAGHRYHAADSHLFRKIEQLNVVLRNVSNELRKRTNSRTMLVVAGDHGMTQTGDHGGASNVETDSFLFAELFSSSRENTTAAREVIREVTERMRIQRCGELCRLNSYSEAKQLPFQLSLQQQRIIPGTFQIDIVPTIAALLNIPIPFSNFGVVIPELVALAHTNADLDGNEGSTQLHAAVAQLFSRLSKLQRCNLEQILRIVAKMGRIAPVESVAESDDLFAVNDAATKTAMWARKQFTSISEGRLVLGAALLIAEVLLFLPVLASSTVSLSAKSLAASLCVSFFLVVCATVSVIGLTSYSANLTNPLVALCVAGVAITGPMSVLIGPAAKEIMSWIQALRCGRHGKFMSLVCCSLLAVIFTRCGVGFSNSFVVKEDDAMLFVLQSLLGILAVAALGSNAPVSWKISLLERILIVAVLFRVAFVLGSRPRIHGTHIHSASSILRDFLAQLNHVAFFAVNVSCSVATTLLCFSSVVGSLKGVWIIVAAAQFYFLLIDGTMLMHLALLVLLLAAVLAPRSMARFAIAYFVVWISSLGAEQAPLNRIILTLSSAALWQLGTIVSHCNAVCGETTRSAIRSIVPCILHAASWIAFFSLGDQCIASSIDWNAAFVGLAEYNFVLGGLFVLLNLLSAPIVTTLTYSLFRISTSSRAAEQLKRNLCSELWGILWCAVAELAMCSIAVGIHRRHLMLWAIFCPKYLCDVGFFLATTIAVLAASSLVMRHPEESDDERRHE